MVIESVTDYITIAKEAKVKLCDFILNINGR